MKYYVETSLENFKAWSGGRDTLEVLIEKGLCDTVEACLEEALGEDVSDTDINDTLWFERDMIAEWCGFSSWEALENGEEEEEEEEEADETDLEEVKDRLNECIENEDDFDTFCNGRDCSSCPFDAHCNLMTKCEEAYNYMLEGYNFDEAIALLNGKEV